VEVEFANFRPFPLLVSEVERAKKAIAFLTEWAIAKALRGVSKGAATKADRFSI
jgi:hypothetical protein